MITDKLSNFLHQDIFCIDDIHIILKLTLYITIFPICMLAEITNVLNVYYDVIMSCGVLLFYIDVVYF